ncbi:hypothetical protein BB558_001488 [Smittium angustum]|uniref:Protein Abitram n=1 Tax=Smittium angustum TaxID=133377 RepID=A0A2U1JBI4_SMIAN|nr:hypothetical protein BB558_001488 [Smittium angustum]
MAVEYDLEKWGSVSEQFTADVSTIYARYYNIYYYGVPTTNVKSEGDVREELSQMIYEAPNELCLVMLPREHKLISDVSGGRDSILKVEINEDLKEYKVSGKRKRDSVGVRHDTELCKIIMKSGREYVINASVNGKLVEINKSVLEKPEVLLEKGCGYFAIIQPSYKKNEKKFSGEYYRKIE